MKRIILIVVASLFINPVTAFDGGFLQEDSYSISYGRGQLGDSGHSGIYRFGTVIKNNWFGIVREIPLGERYSAGLGFHFGGPEIELATTSAPFSDDELALDLNRFLSASVRLQFSDIMPYAQLSYQYVNPRKNFLLRIDTGLRYLQIEDLAIDLDGEVGDYLEVRRDVMRELRRDTLAELEDYYLEPIFSFRLHYRFS